MMIESNNHSDTSFIVGDAGGTGTQWRVVKGEQILQFETIGFNAYTHNLDDLKTNIDQVFGAHITSEMPKYLYAAGVDTEQQRLEAISTLQEIFHDNIVVENDLVGVARSLCGKNVGNVCILGTGSNACYYNGEAVNKVSASLGYVLGDEGSGAHLGKRLMMGVFRERFAKEIVEEFQDTFKLTSHEVIQRIYHQARPNHYLASFAKFVHQHRNHPDMYHMIYRAFEDFFDAFFFDVSTHKVPFYFSGSIAWYFSDILREVTSSRNVVINNIAQSPIAGLVLYHQQYG